jgi:7,8-dihydropterin-6-yl-methyl-4-(beta-D-ribofuranosyl)aminobenzene 5'-phosphate synthase
VFEAESVTITVLVEKHPDLTAPGLTELEVATAMPTHSSALRTHVQLCRDLSANYVQPAVGTVLHFAR